MKKYILALILVILLIPAFSFASAHTRGITKLSITVLSPNGGERLVAGKRYEIKWKSHKIKKVEISITDYSHTSELAATIVTDINASKGSYVWMIPQNVFSLHPNWKSGDNFKIFIAELKQVPIYDEAGRFAGYRNEYGAHDESDNYFNIVQASHDVEPSITVISPNGGEELIEGKNYTILWSARRLPHDARIGIYLFRADGAEMDIARGLPPFSGAYTWNVTTSGGWAVGARPPTAKLAATLLGIRTAHANSGTYTIAVSAEWGGFIGVSDKSNAPFNIVSPNPTVDIKANGSDTPAGVPYNLPFIVSWTSTGVDYCSGYGFFVPLVGGGLWTELMNLPAAGSKMLYAKHQNFGYISPLRLGIQCFNISSGQSVTDEILVPVRPPFGTQ